MYIILKNTEKFAKNKTYKKILDFIIKNNISFNIINFNSF